jgi:osmotically-inducible protein OsmY
MELKTKIERRLRNDNRIDASHIEVEVENGKVTLKGSVDTHLASALAQEHSAIVHGVSYIDNRIEVNFPGKIATPSDSAIRARIHAVLLLKPDIRPEDLILVVSKGVVFIDGFVKTLKDKRLIGHIAVQEQGVMAVHNNLLVLPARDRTDTDIAEDIRRALSDSELAIDYGVSVQVMSGAATFNGEVSNEADCRTLTDIASTVPGVVEIRSFITLIGNGPRSTNRVKS